MSNTLGLATGSEQIRPFHCPHCNEIINAKMEQCPSSSRPVDHDLAKNAADIQAKIAQAYSDADYVKITAQAVLVFLALSFVPVIGWMAFSCVFFF